MKSAEEWIEQFGPLPITEQEIRDIQIDVLKWAVKGYEERTSSRASALTFVEDEIKELEANR